MVTCAALASAVVAPSASASVDGTVRTAADVRPLQDLAAPSTEVTAGIVTFEGQHPTGAQLEALRALGLRAQGLKHLPMALVRGTHLRIAAALQGGAAPNFFPDERLELASEESNRAIGVDTAQSLGFTGRGTTVAVVDTGIESTHPDLTDHVVHNVKSEPAVAVNDEGDRDSLKVVVQAALLEAGTTPRTKE